jgi:hypothetical protein
MRRWNVCPLLLALVGASACSDDTTPARPADDVEPDACSVADTCTDPDTGESDADETDGSDDAGDSGSEDATDTGEDAEPPPPLDRGVRDDSLDPLGGSWSDAFSAAGLQGSFDAAGLSAIEDAEGRLIVGGRFDQVSGLAARNIAVWDGTRWETLGDGLPIAVHALAFDDDGRLYAGGRSAGGGFGIDPPPELFVWSDDEWQSLATLSSFSVVHALVWHEDALWIGGDFDAIDETPVTGLARWDGASFVAVADLGEGADVSSILPTEGGVCIAGAFAEVDGAAASWVACEDEGVWAARDAGLNSRVNDLIVYDGELVAAGYFSIEAFAGADNGIAIARLDGDEWKALGGGVNSASVIQARRLQLDDDGGLLVAGQFGVAGRGDDAIRVGNVARWDGTRWESLEDGVANESVISISDGVFGLLVLRSGDVIAAGVFSRASNTGAANLARWDGTRWSVIDEPGKELIGISGVVRAVASDGVDSVYVGGSFAVVGEDAARGIARLTGNVWTAMDEGLDGVSAIAVTADGVVYAGGDFVDQGLRAATFFASWDGSMWRSPDANVDGPVAALAECPDGRLVVGGGFAQAGSVASGRVAAWNGSTWEGLGGGFTGEDVYVSAVACTDDGTVWAGGELGTVGLTENVALARWNGAAWESVGAFDRGVYALATYGDTVYVGGGFTEIDGASHLGVAQYEGGAFAALGGGLATEFDFSPASVMGLVAKENGVFAAGYFTQAEVDATPASFVAWYDGARWHGLGEGVDDIAEAVAVHDRALFVGGPFQQAGGRPSQGIARWEYGATSR